MRRKFLLREVLTNLRLTFIIASPVAVVHNIHFRHALLIYELYAAELACVISARLLKLVQREVVAINL